MKLRNRPTSGNIGRLAWEIQPRSAERRMESWAGVGPVIDSGDFHSPDRHVSGVEFFAGKYMLAIFWT